ncbi:aldolase [Microbacterium sp. A84]|uniref:aldolase n=1 Tax=Microbacterium sp. A84 TaxID=3450715 RepID=UPI003F44499D
MTLTQAMSPLTTDKGGFVMLAIDQRESLRNMLASAPGAADTISDADLSAFKVTAVNALAQNASAILIDRGFGDDAIARLNTVAPGRLILSADVLIQPVGGELEATALDPSITPDVIASTGASAIKLLVLWEADGSNDAAIRLSTEFIDLARNSNVSSLLEAIVRPPRDGEWRDEAHRHEAILAAGKALCDLGPSIYKAQVPGYTAGDLSQVESESAKLTALIDVPWVVLSNGVRSDEFSAAVEGAVRGGADGFLAGRAIWADAIASGRADEELATVSVERLRNLGRLVAEHRRS